MTTSNRSECNISGRRRIEWATCSACDGRIHETSCTTKRNPKKDCCEARHRMLFEQGQTRGIYDRSIVMYDESFSGWGTKS